MPHLSPISWILSMITFWTIATILVSSIWWSYSSSPKIAFMSPKSMTLTKWNWQ